MKELLEILVIIFIGLLTFIAALSLSVLIGIGYGFYCIGRFLSRPKKSHCWASEWR